jgi:hypothetical protein
MRGTVGEIEACAGGAALTLQLLDEVVVIVNAVGEPALDHVDLGIGVLPSEAQSDHSVA